MKYKVESYSREPLSVLGHISYVQEYDNLEDAERDGHKRCKQRHINISIYEDGKLYMQIAHLV